MISFWFHLKQCRQFHRGVSGKPIMRGVGRGRKKKREGYDYYFAWQTTIPGQDTVQSLPLCNFHSLASL